MPFAPGQTGNLGGRPRTGRATQGVLRESDFKSASNVNALDLIASIAACTRFAVTTRLQAAVNLATWQNLKPSEKAGRDLQLPKATTVEIALDNIATISAEAAGNRLGLDVASKLISHQQSYIDAKTATNIETEMAALKQMVQQLAAERAVLPLDLNVFGGLSDLPGTSIQMPVLRRSDGTDSDDQQLLP
jgi:hypothetical protein